MSYGYNQRRQGGPYSPMSAMSGSAMSANQYDYDYNQNYAQPYNNYPNQYSKYNSQSVKSQQYYSPQQAHYQQKQFRVQSPAGMNQTNMLYSVNPEAAMAYRQRKMQQAAERKYQKLLKLTNRLRDQLRLQTIPVSKAANSLVNYTIRVKDPLLPSVWGPIEKGDNPYAATNSKCSCIIM